MPAEQPTDDVFDSPRVEPKQFLVHWRYDDRSASGVLPIVIDEAQMKLLNLIECEIGFERHVEFVQVRPL